MANPKRFGYRNITCQVLNLLHQLICSVTSPKHFSLQNLYVPSYMIQYTEAKQNKTLCIIQTRKEKTKKKKQNIVYTGEVANVQVTTTRKITKDGAHP